MPSVKPGSKYFPLHQHLKRHRGERIPMTFSEVEAVEVEVRARRVVFQRPSQRYVVRKEAGLVRWDAEMIRALRRHLAVDQAGMADVLGVRQQTISEWETGIYAPSRGRSKHLTIIAERAGFPLEGGSPPKTPPRC